MRSSQFAYQRYLQSAEWKALRLEVLANAGHRCTGCGSEDNLQAHHLTYERLGHERLTDLMALCDLCHAREHGRSPSGGMPIAGPSIAELNRFAAARDDARRRQPLLQYAINARQSLDALEAALTADHLWTRDLKRAVRQVRLALERVVGMLGG